MIKIEMDKKMTVKMIATDMDGTLLYGQGQLDLPRLATILDELDKRDIRFVVATGNSTDASAIGRFGRTNDLGSRQWSADF